MSEKNSFSKDLKKIKRFYGDDMASFAKENLSTFLETPGLLPDLLLKTFYPNKSLYKDLVYEYKTEEFAKYLHSFLCEKILLLDVNESPYELLRKKNYTLYHCHTEDEIQSFKKYYTEEEKLCTFRTNRLNTCHVFFAVRDDALELKREDFLYPSRQDDYGTSVIGIQFTRGNINLLSIKNRYNHIVINPDATFSNNLENIIGGLTRSFEKRYGYNINSNFRGFELSNYIKDSEDKFHKYNYCINNTYYTTNNAILNEEDNFFDKEKYIVCDYFVIDLVNNKISTFDKRINDSFVDYYTNISKINVTKEDDGKLITIYQDDEVSYIKLDKENKIIEYRNDYLKNVGDNFLYYNDSLKKLSLSNVVSIGNCFLCNNNSLEKVNLENVEYIGDDFFYSNNSLDSINFSKLKVIGDNFFFDNNLIDEVLLDHTVRVGNSFFATNRNMKKISMNNVMDIGNCFLHYNNSILELNFPNAIKIGDEFMFNNKVLERLYLPKTQYIGRSCLCHNYSLYDYDLSSINNVGKYFLLDHTDDKIKTKVYRKVS